MIEADGSEGGTRGRRGGGERRGGGGGGGGSGCVVRSDINFEFQREGRRSQAKVSRSWRYDLSRNSGAAAAAPEVIYPRRPREVFVFCPGRKINKD